ncbi:hypothetical protein N7326_00940 [Corynebacterium sp. ES2794-CONJ1]|uniref:hypothetical protein n=1 Tax=unclassified Corynebacterium TaxID=2624378 RepID=UPI002168B41E|nr:MULTISPECIES: hypothetical protein [unclassified Corynebacterium]MCS4489233.1 hypothetical protein [Corynebacterium sp. ES2775-CONJ]MCS4491046.1 hypothetical protein [Corynebacterium sp. ES2715-CONJ3]MCS4531073.1 hypothetical protein [Corynebacterium sp. ES2730-CONJ]MCU9518440.1 hypothetical protein [Corynebacterium sp. ES2794-CONJ1]
MKIIRTAVASIATAALLTTGTAAVSQAATTTSTSTAPDSPKPTGERSSSEDLQAGSQDANGNISAKKIGEWIGVITSVISVLGALLGFLAKAQKQLF